MTRKEVHNMLDQPRRLAVRIKRLSEEREELIGILMPGGMSMDDRVQKTPEDLFAKVMAEVADLDAEIEGLRIKRADEIIRIRGLLEGDDVRMAVVSLSYIAQMPMREIATIVHYSLKSVYRLRGEGLDMVGVKVENNEKTLHGRM